MSLATEQSPGHEPARIDLPRQPGQPPTLRAVPPPPAVPWPAGHVRGLAAADGVALLVAAATAVLVAGAATAAGALLAAVVVITWWSALVLNRAYETRFLAAGTEEFRRTAAASLRVGAVLAAAVYTLQLPVPRAFVAVVVPVGTGLLLLGRCCGRWVVVAGRRSGRYCQRVVVVGAETEARDLATQLSATPRTGMCVVGICQPDVHTTYVRVGRHKQVPVIGSLATVPGAASMARADAVVVAAGGPMTAEVLQQLAYEFEGSGTRLMVSPALPDVAGARTNIRATGGATLIHVDGPELAGPRKVVKEVLDRVVAATALLALAPLLIALMVAVRVTTPGPAFFKQVRVGRDGDHFRVWKLRTMHQDAETRLAEVQHLNEHDGVLFKLRRDPRVTPLGRVLRRWSLDELPQLINVVRGEMSLVGPRPPLPTEVEAYDGHAHRRLLVKPGITGLWQVSGRADLTWDETVRLDLHYVENWSLGLDLSLLARTVLAVVNGRGAY